MALNEIPFLLPAKFQDWMLVRERHEILDSLEDTFQSLYLNSIGELLTETQCTSRHKLP